MLAIIQARMSSRRLPGKVLMNISGQPMLAWVCRRTMQAKNVDQLLVATSNQSSDDPIEEFCSQENISCCRGSLNDVVSRFLFALRIKDRNEFVRINADSPLIDPYLIDWAIDIFLKGQYDVATNVFKRSFPKGQSVEVIRRSAFESMYSDNLTLDELEHVTKAFYKNAIKYKIKNFNSDISFADIQLSVDSQNDIDMINLIFNLSKNKPGGWRDLVNLNLQINK